MSLRRILNTINTIGQFPLLGKPLFWGAIVLIMFSLTSVTAASMLEDHDQFCASCHMQPEDTYDQRAQDVIHGSGGAVDLASQHYTANQPFRCIDCHRGDQGLGDRATTLTVGANDLTTYLLGSPNQTLEKGTVTSPQIIDNSCMQCHLDTTLTVGFPNHFHNKLPAAYTAWRRGAKLLLPVQSPDKYQKDLEAGLELIRIDITCISCHKGHITSADGTTEQFIDLTTTIYPVCEDCHLSELGRVLGLGLEEEP